jgi:type IV pilus assembly protein PilE
MGKKRGFTIIEILITLLIVSTLAAVAIPGFAKAKTKAEKNQAIAYLRTIRSSMRMYYGKWKNTVALANTTAIKNALGVETQLTGYTFAVTAPTTSTFNATATRTSDSQTLTLNQDGAWSGTNTPLPPS